jgi:hypothetical protein
MKILDFEKFKTECAKFDKPSLKALLWDWALQRTLHELVLVDAIDTCRENGKHISKTETLADLDNIVRGERILIGLLGRTEAAKVYGMLEGITSDVKTVDWVLGNDFVQHYIELLKTQQTKAKP